MNYDKEWYDNLQKPKFQPPAWIFAPVWIFLYILMGVAFLLVLFSQFRFINIIAYLFFAAQLVINLQWSPVFFKEHNLRKAFLLCVLLSLVVFLTMLIFYHISKIAGVLFLPYFLWCLFATLISFEILELNEW